MNEGGSVFVAPEADAQVQVDEISAVFMLDALIEAIVFFRKATSSINEAFVSWREATVPRLAILLP